MSLSHCIRCGNPSLAGRADCPAASVRSGARHLRREFDPLDQILILLIPSSIMDSCAGVNATLPYLAEGQTNRPFYSRFRNMQGH